VTMDVASLVAFLKHLSVENWCQIVMRTIANLKAVLFFFLSACFSYIWIHIFIFSTIDI